MENDQPLQLHLKILDSETKALYSTDIFIFHITEFI